MGYSDEVLPLPSEDSFEIGNVERLEDWQRVYIRNDRV